MSSFPKTAPARLRRLPQRGRYDRETIYQILDAALICHVGLVEAGQPFVLPTNFARLDDTLVLHGARASRLLKHVAAGRPVCVEATLVDGLVLARSAFHHAVNYRSVMVFGVGRLVETEAEKLAALEAISEHLLPGRWAEVRPPSRQELNATRVVAIPITQASAKIRTGPPKDDAADYALPVWAGVVPLREAAHPPAPDEHAPAGLRPPRYLTQYLRRKR